MSIERNRRRERAREVASAYRGRPGFIGAYLGGSSTRPYADEHSDLDVFVAVEDEAYERLGPRERYVLTIDPGPPRRKDVEIICLPWSELQAELRSRRDRVLSGFVAAEVLFAVDERLPDLIRSINAIPEDVRQQRLRVHYYEILWTADKAAKNRARGNLANARQLEVAAIEAARKILFLARGAWPARLDWATQELAAAGVPEPLRAAWEREACAETPAIATLRKQLDDWLTAEGHAFHHNTFVLTQWCLFDPEGRRASERWTSVY